MRCEITDHEKLCCNSKSRTKTKQCRRLFIISTDPWRDFYPVALYHRLTFYPRLTPCYSISFLQHETGWTLDLDTWKLLNSPYIYLFILSFWRTLSPFRGVTDTPVFFYIWWRLHALSFKTRVDPFFRAFSPVILSHFTSI